MKVSAPFALLLIVSLFTSCSKDNPEDDLDLSNHHPELSMYERVLKNDPYLLEGNWETIRIFEFDANDQRHTTGRAETLTVTKTHWIQGDKSVRYRLEFRFECQWLVDVWLLYPNQERRLTLQYTNENGYYYGSQYWMCSEPYSFATLQLEPAGSDPWRIDKVYVPAD